METTIALYILVQFEYRHIEPAIMCLQLRCRIPGPYDGPAPPYQASRSMQEICQNAHFLLKYLPEELE